MGTTRRIVYAVQSVGVDLAAETGPAVLIRQTVQGLRQSGHQVTVMALQGRTITGSDGPEWSGDKSKVPLGLSGTAPFKVVESGVRRLQSMLSLPYFGLFESLRFSEAARRLLPKYQLCHEYHTLFGLGATMACRRLGIPRVVTVDADLLLESALVGQPLRGFHGAFARWAAGVSLRTADRLICVSEAAKRHFVSEWGIDGEKIVVIANGVDTAKFECAESPEAARVRIGLEKGPVVAFVGGFQPWHGLELLVEAFAVVVEKRPDAQLLLVGDGPARPAVEQKIEELGLSKSVIITGYVKHEEVLGWLTTADVAVAPYPPLPEELWFSPLKLYEYMAAGKAIVASRAGQIAEVIEDGHNGMLVEPGNAAQLTQAIIDLLDDPEQRQRFGENARQQATAEHSWAAYTQRLEQLYQAILSSR